MGTNNITSSGMPEYGDTANYGDEDNFAYETDPDNADYYILTNIRELAVKNSDGTGGNYDMELAIDYTVNPALVNGGGIDSDGNYVNVVNYYQKNFEVKVTINLNNDGKTFKTSSSELSVEMHTKVEPAVDKNAVKYTKRWDDSWGDMPDSEEDSVGTHFYVAWNLYASYLNSGNTQPFTCSWSENTVHEGYIDGEDTVQAGEVVGYVVNGTFQTEVPYYDRSAATSFLGSDMLMDDDLVIIKYPISLLEELNEKAAEAEEKGEIAPKLILTNEAVLTTNWKSGYVTEKRVNADFAISAEADDSTDDSGDGEEGSEPEINDSFSKTRTSGCSRYKDGDQETILDDGNDVELKWTQTYEGNGGTYTNKIPVSWDESSGKYTALKRTISIQDGVSGDLVYSSASDAATNDLWKSSEDNITLEDSDYNFTSLTITVTEMDAEKIGKTWTEPYTNTKFAEYGEVRIYIRTAGNAEFKLYKTAAVSANEAKTAGVVQLDALPSGTVGYEIQYDSECYSTRLQVDVVMALHATQRVKKLVQADVNLGLSSQIKNAARCKIWRTDSGSEESPLWAVSTRGADTDSAAGVIYELNVSKTFQKTVKYAGEAADAGGGSNSQDAVMYIAGWNYNTSQTPRKKAIKRGVFYDLLPAGTTVDTTTILGLPITENTENNPYSGIAGSATDVVSTKTYSDVAALTAALFSKSCYTVSFTENWQDSGRTLMKITFAIPDGVTAVGAQFWYKLRNSESNILSKGTTVDNYVAFVNTTDNAVKPESCSEPIENMEAVKDYYEELDSLNSGWISYSKASVNYTAPTLLQRTFTKTVNTNDGKGYSSSGSTIPSNEYTYCLSYVIDGQSTNIVIYDILEHEAYRTTVEANFTQSEWYGTLKSVDVSEIASIKNSADGREDYTCAPVVYYYVVTDDAEKKSEDFVAWAREKRDILQKNQAAFKPENLTANGSGWTTEKPSDLSTIIAVAVDCSKDTGGDTFVFAGANVKLNLYLVMTAPDKLPETEEETEEESKSLETYNEALIYARTDSNADYITKYSSSSVTTLEKLEPTITKTSDPVSGTDSQNPTPVGNGEDLNYTLDITNTNSYFSISDVVVEDVIADDLAVDPEKIKVYYGNDEKNALLINDSPLAELVSVESGVTYERTVERKVTTTDENGNTVETEKTETETTTGKKITLKITGKISPGDTVHFLIPTSVEVTHTGTVIKNTAEIVSVEGKSVKIPSKTTYHQAMANLTVFKTVEGSMGSRVKEFAFSLTVTGTDLPDSIAYTKTDADGNRTTGKWTKSTTEDTSGSDTNNDGDTESTGTGGSSGTSETRKFTFTIAHDEKIAISLPAGVTYTLTETDANANGYTVTYKVGDDETESSVTSQMTLPLAGQKIYFTNTREAVVPTAAHTGTRPLILFAAAAGLGLAGLSISRRRRRK